MLERKEGNVLFNDTLYLWFYVEHMVKNQSDSERRNSLPPLLWLFFLISSKESFICTIPTDRIEHTTAFVLHCASLAGTRNRSMDPP